MKRLSVATLLLIAPVLAQDKSLEGVVQDFLPKTERKKKVVLQDGTVAKDLTTEYRASGDINIEAVIEGENGKQKVKLSQTPLFSDKDLVTFSFEYEGQDYTYSINEKTNKIRLRRSEGDDIIDVLHSEKKLWNYAKSQFKKYQELLQPKNVHKAYFKDIRRFLRAVPYEVNSKDYPTIRYRSWALTKDFKERRLRFVSDIDKLKPYLDYISLSINSNNEFVIEGWYKLPDKRGNQHLFLVSLSDKGVTGQLDVVQFIFCSDVYTLTKSKDSTISMRAQSLPYSVEAQREIFSMMERFYANASKAFHKEKDALIKVGPPR